MPLSISDINLPGIASLVSTVTSANSNITSLQTSRTVDEANITSLLNSRGTDENLIAVANGNITTL